MRKYYIHNDKVKYEDIFTIIDNVVYYFSWRHQKWMFAGGIDISALKPIDDPYKIVRKDGREVDNTGIYLEMFWEEIDL